MISLPQKKRTSALNNSYRLLTLQSSIKLPNYCMKCYRTANKNVAYELDSWIFTVLPSSTDT